MRLVLVKDLLSLFFPLLVGRFGWAAVRITSTALIGHSGTFFLAASSVSDLWMQCFEPFIYGSNSVAALCGQAYGAQNFILVGVWLQVALTFLYWVALPVMMLQSAAPVVMRYVFNYSNEHSFLTACAWYSVFSALCVPPVVIQAQVILFLNAQKITRPAASCTVISLVLILLLGPQLVLGFPFKDSFGNVGFWACPVVTTKE